MPPNTSASGGILSPGTPYPLDDDALDTLIQTLMVGITGLPANLVRPRWQPVPQKMPEYTVNWLSVGVTVDEPDEGPYFTFDNVTQSGTLIRHENITALATFYGPLAKTYAAIARDGLSIPQNLEGLLSNGMKVIETGPIRAMHELVNQTWFRRRDMSIFFRRQVTRTYLVDSLASASVNLIDDTVVNDTINVP